MKIVFNFDQNGPPYPDAISFYEGAKFQACQPIRVVFIGQPAIDSGGVK